MAVSITASPSIAVIDSNYPIGTEKNQNQKLNDLQEAGKKLRAMLDARLACYPELKAQVFNPLASVLPEIQADLNRIASFGGRNFLKKCLLFNTILGPEIVLALRDPVLSAIDENINFCVGHIPFEPFDEKRTNDPAYLADYMIYMEAKTKEIRDRDLIIAFTHLPLSSDIIQNIVKEGDSITQQALSIRTWLANNHNHPLFRESSLRFDHCNLRSIPIDLISLFSHLQSLDLSYNEITDISEEDIDSLHLLQILNMSHNHLGNIPDAIENLSQLKVLYLNDNQIAIIPDAIKNLHCLEHLDLSYNLIEIIPDAMGYLGQLRILELANNKIIDIPDAIKRLLQLSHLNLGHNQIRVFPSAMGQLMQLRTLYLSCNQIVDMPEEILGKLSSLQVVEVFNNPITVLPLTVVRLQRNLGFD